MKKLFLFASISILVFSCDLLNSEEGLPDPPEVSDITFTVSENLEAGATVGTLSSLPADFDYVATSTNFLIDPDGQITLKSKLDLTEDLTEEFTTNVVYKDGGANAATFKTTITVTNEIYDFVGYWDLVGIEDGVEEVWATWVFETDGSSEYWEDNYYELGLTWKFDEVANEIEIEVPYEGEVFYLFLKDIIIVDESTFSAVYQEGDDEPSDDDRYDFRRRADKPIYTNQPPEFDTDYINTFYSGKEHIGSYGYVGINDFEDLTVISYKFWHEYEGVEVDDSEYFEFIEDENESNYYQIRSTDILNGNAVDTYYLTVTVSDGEYEESGTFTIEVYADEPVLEYVSTLHGVFPLNPDFISLSKRSWGTYAGDECGNISYVFEDGVDPYTHQIYFMTEGYFRDIYNGFEETGKGAWPVFHIYSFTEDWRELSGEYSQDDFNTTTLEGMKEAEAEGNMFYYAPFDGYTEDEPQFHWNEGSTLISNNDSSCGTPEYYKSGNMSINLLIRDYHDNGKPYIVFEGNARNLYTSNEYGQSTDDNLWYDWYSSVTWEGWPVFERFYDHLDTSGRHPSNQIESKGRVEIQK